MAAFVEAACSGTPRELNQCLLNGVSDIDVKERPGGWLAEATALYCCSSKGDFRKDNLKFLLTCVLSTENADPDKSRLGNSLKNRSAGRVRGGSETAHQDVVHEPRESELKSSSSSLLSSLLSSSSSAAAATTTTPQSTLQGGSAFCNPMPNTYLNINWKNASNGRTALHIASHLGYFENIKILLDFGADRSIVDMYGKTSLDLAQRTGNNINREKCVSLLKDYFPTEDDFLLSQLEHKLDMDMLFETYGTKRFNQHAIDLKFDPIKEKLKLFRDIDSADLENLKRRPLPSFEMLLYAISETVKKNVEGSHSHLLAYYCRKIFGLNYRAVVDTDDHVSSFSLRTDGFSLFDKLIIANNRFAIPLVEELLFVGLDPSPFYLKTVRSQILIEPEILSLFNVATSVIVCTHMSRVLSLVVLLYHKFTFLDFSELLYLVQTLLDEHLANPETEQAAAMGLTVHQYRECRCESMKLWIGKVRDTPPWALYDVNFSISGSSSSRSSSSSSSSSSSNHSSNSSNVSICGGGPKIFRHCNNDNNNDNANSSSSSSSSRSCRNSNNSSYIDDTSISKCMGYADKAPLEEDRTIVIQASIIRIMKARSQLQHRQLVYGVINQLASLKLSTAVIEAQIEILIDQDYLERDSSDHNMYKLRKS